MSGRRSGVRRGVLNWAEILTPSVALAERFFGGTLVFLGLMLLFRLVGHREAGGPGLTDLLIVVVLVVVLVVDAASAADPGGWVGDDYLRAARCAYARHALLTSRRRERPVRIRR